MELHVVEGESISDTAILEFIEQHQIDLLLMGTIARGGLDGLTIGNTADRLVRRVHCSMLAVKPKDLKPSIGSTATIKT